MFSPFDPLAYQYAIRYIHAHVAHTSRVANLSTEIIDTCTVMMKLCRQDSRPLRAPTLAIYVLPNGRNPNGHPQRNATRVARTLRTEYRLYEDFVKTLKTVLT